MFPATRKLIVGARIGAAVLAVAALTGCGGDLVSTGPTTGAAGKTGASAPAASAAPSTPATPHNAADVAFASRMIPHNVQALAATQMVDQKATKPAVKSLASAMNKTQLPEIESLSQWLTNWGQPVPTGMIASGQGAMGITEDDLSKLSKTSGAAFDKLWLNTMITHQQNAVMIAQAEVAQGQNPQAKALAQKILTDRQARLATLKGLLK